MYTLSVTSFSESAETSKNLKPVNQQANCKCQQAVCKGQEVLVKDLVKDTKNSFEKQLAKEVKVNPKSFHAYVRNPLSSRQCAAAAAWANRVLGMIKRNFNSFS